MRDSNDPKQVIRDAVWEKLERALASPPSKIWGKIPDFDGAEATAYLLRDLDMYRAARVVSVNPDSPQRSLREMVMRDGKILVMGTPGLKHGLMIFKDIPEEEARRASTLQFAEKYGKVIGWDVPKIDLKVVGSVAVSIDGGRLGKGSGYFDLGYSILSALKVIDESTPIVTNVHPAQIVENIPMNPNDVPVDYIVTPEEVIETTHKFAKPKGISWGIITKALIEKHPILQKFKT